MGIVRVSGVSVVSWTMLALASVARADAVLENFDSPDRVPGEFTVEFWSGGEFKNSVAAAEPLRRGPLKAPPATEAETRRIAAELATRVGARLCGIEFSSTYHGFTICDADSARVREILGKDPRIKGIHASIQTVLLR